MSTRREVSRAQLLTLVAQLKESLSTQLMRVASLEEALTYCCTHPIRSAARIIWTRITKRKFHA